MATIARCRAIWQNFPGAPGYSNFYNDGALSAAPATSWAEAVQAFFQGISTYFPQGLTISIDPVVVLIEDSTGQMTGQVAITPPTPTSGGTLGTYSGTSGALVDWTTSSFRNGRRVRGRTYLVPLKSSVYDTDGSLTAGFLGDLRTSAATYAAFGDGTNCVYSRPTAANPVGGHSVITGTIVPDLAVVMRSRRT